MHAATTSTAQIASAGHAASTQPNGATGPDESILGPLSIHGADVPRCELPARRQRRLLREHLAISTLLWAAAAAPARVPAGVALAAAFAAGAQQDAAHRRPTHSRMAGGELVEPQPPGRAGLRRDRVRPGRAGHGAGAAACFAQNIMRGVLLIFLWSCGDLCF